VAVAIAEEALTKGWAQSEIIAQASNAKARLDMEAEVDTVSKQVGSHQAATHARQQQAKQEAQGGPQPAPAGQSPDPRQQQPERPEDQTTVPPADYDGPLCDVCGGPRDEATTLELVLPEPVQNDVGLERYQVCLDEGQALLQLVGRLQSQAPKG